jgi:hypothetical protein
MSVLLDLLGQYCTAGAKLVRAVENGHAAFQINKHLSLFQSELLTVRPRNPFLCAELSHLLICCGPPFTCDRMPQARQRIVFCDCLDCVQQPSTTDVQSSTSPANEAAAKQEPPPKCLMFVLSGALLPRADAENPGSATVLDVCNLPHMNRATAQGNLSLLTLREAAAPGKHTTCCTRCCFSSRYLHRQLS